MGHITAPVSGDPSALDIASARAENAPWHDGFGDAAGAKWQAGRSAAIAAVHKAGVRLADPVARSFLHSELPL